MSDMNRKQLALEGEIKWLRNSLKEKDQCITELRGSIHLETVRQRQVTQNKEKQHSKDVDALKADLQFKGTFHMTYADAVATFIV